jgi:hypothetical protein
VDLSREARNLFRFNHNFRRTRAVTFPTPHYPLVAPDVLVESLEAGHHISTYIAAGQQHPYSHRLAELGSGTMLQVREGGGEGVTEEGNNGGRAVRTPHGGGMGGEGAGDEGGGKSGGGV